MSCCNVIPYSLFRSFDLTRFFCDIIGLLILYHILFTDCSDDEDDHDDGGGGF